MVWANTLVQNVTQTVPSLWGSTLSGLPRWRTSRYPFTAWIRKCRLCSRWRELRCPCTENRWLPKRSRSKWNRWSKTIIHTGYPPNWYFKSTAWFCYRSDSWSNPSVREEDQRLLYARRSTNGVETRTSSPVCIKRGKDFQSINLKGFFPAGEGAGYAGGILSAGIDGIKAAEALAISMAEQNQAEKIEIA